METTNHMPTSIDVTITAQETAMADRMPRPCEIEATEGDDNDQITLQHVNDRRRLTRVARRAVVWGSLAGIGLLAAIHSLLTSPSSDNDSDGSQTHRWLAQDADVMPISTEFHKKLFPLHKSDHWGFGLAAVSLLIAASGGIGGGGMLIPIYVIILGFPPRHAIPLSNVTVFGGAIANTLANRRKRHPLADRPLVDWDLMVMMEPMTIGGALVGAIINKVVSEVILTILLVALLACTAWTTLKKAVQMYKKENELERMATISTAKDIEEAQGLLQGKHMAQSSELSYSTMSVQEISTCQELKQVINNERKAPVQNVALLTGMFAVVLLVNLLKGGGAFKSPVGVQCGSTAFWLANLFLLFFIITVSLYAREILLEKTRRKAACQYTYVEGDIKWDERATLVYPTISCAAGFFAGMFGVVSA
jgi:uncharacterized membrane protein YfcA